MPSAQDFDADLLPSSSTKLERALEKALRLPPEVWEAAGRVGDVKSDLSDDTVPFLIWELGLEPLMPYIRDPRRVLKDGREWQRVRGTPVSITTALGWIDVDAIVEENAEGSRWDLFQLGLDIPPVTIKEIADIIGLTRLSKASNTDLIRIYSGYDLRATRLNKARINGPFLVNDWSGVWTRPNWPKLSFGRSFIGLADFGMAWPITGWRDQPWPETEFKSRPIFRADNVEFFKRQRGFRVNRHPVNGPERVDPQLSRGSTNVIEITFRSDLAKQAMPWASDHWPSDGLPSIPWPLESWPQGRWAEIAWPFAPWQAGGWKAGNWPDDSWRSPVWPDGGWEGRSWDFGHWRDEPYDDLREKPWPLGPWKAEHRNTRSLTTVAVPYQVPYDAKTFTPVSHLNDREIGWLLGPWPEFWPRGIDWPEGHWTDAPFGEWPFAATSLGERFNSHIASLAHRKPANWPYDSEPLVPVGDGGWPGPWSDNPWPGVEWNNSPWPGSKWQDISWPSISWGDAPWFGAGWQDAPWPGVRWSHDQWPGSAWGNKPWPDIGWKAKPWPNTALPAVPWPDGEMDERWGHDVTWPTVSWPTGISDDVVWARQHKWPAIPWPDGIAHDTTWGFEAPWPGIGWPDGDWLKGRWLSQSWPDDPWHGAESWRDIPWPAFGWPRSDYPIHGWPALQWFDGTWPDWPLPEGRWPEINTHRVFKSKRVLH